MKNRLSILAISIASLPTAAVAEAGGPRIAYVKPVNNGHEIYLHLGALGDVNSFDVRRLTDQLVHGSPTAPKLFDAASGFTAAFCRIGDGFHFSPDDARFIHQTPHSAKGDTIMIGACGSVQALTAKGTWGKSDWRPDPAAPPAP